MTRQDNRVVTVRQRKNDIVEWLENPVTRAYFASLKQKVKDIEDEMSSGTYLNMDSVEGTAIATARAVGRCDGLGDALNVVGETIDDDSES